MNAPLTHSPETIQGAIEAADAVAHLMIMTAPHRRRGEFDWYTPSRGQLVNELIEQYAKDMEAQPALFVEALIKSMERDVADEAYDRANP